jgi:hypothetical protein
MTDAAIAKVDALMAFRARCEARAYLVDAGEIDFYDAVDELQADAEDAGLVDEVGQDTVQEAMTAAFAELRRQR